MLKCEGKEKLFFAWVMFWAVDLNTLKDIYTYYEFQGTWYWIFECVIDKKALDKF